MGRFAVILDSLLSRGLGDYTLMSGAIRDLHHFKPGMFQIAVNTWCPEIFENNPFVTALDKMPEGAKHVAVDVPTNNYSDDCPHLITLYHRALAKALDLSHIPVARLAGDIRISGDERNWKPDFLDRADQPYWIVFAGGKGDFETKWWSPASYQAVVDALAGKVKFVQVGGKDHWHTPLKRCINRVGKWSIRDVIRATYRADGILSPISWGMHLAAAVPCPAGKPARRAAVVIAGGREPVPFIQYPAHRVLHTIGQLDCCCRGGCWRYLVTPKSDRKDSPCKYPTAMPGVLAAKCMAMITPQMVADAIAGFYDRGKLIGSLELPDKTSSRDELAAWVDAHPSIHDQALCYTHVTGKPCPCSDERWFVLADWIKSLKHQLVEA